MDDKTNTYIEGYRAGLKDAPFRDDASMEYTGGYRVGLMMYERAKIEQNDFIEKEHLEQ